MRHVVIATVFQLIIVSGLASVALAAPTQEHSPRLTKQASPPDAVVLPPRGPRFASRPSGPELLLDFGRNLDPYLAHNGLRPSPKHKRRATPDWLSLIEKNRLDAHRIWAAPGLSTEEKLERLVAVVKHRFPDDVRRSQAHERLLGAELQNHSLAKLSRRAKLRVGSNFERTWLLKGLLEEVGVKASVQNGQIIDVIDRPRGACTWLTAIVDGQERLIDPSAAQPLPETRNVIIKRSGSTSHRRSISATETLNGWLYLPN